MASNTSNLNLLKKDPFTDGKDTFNIRTMLNENWDKIDEAHGQTNARIDSLKTVLDNVGNLHVWEKCLYSYSVENSQNKTRVSLTTNTDYQYSSSVKGGPNGTELVEPQTFTTPSAYGDISTLSNKYILNPSDGKIYLWTSNNSNSSGWYYDCNEIITVRTLEHTDYLTSTDPDAYTEGTVDSTTITYLGQLGEPKVEVGSYVGTGTYGSSNPNSLTFGFEPKLVVISPKRHAEKDGYIYGGIPWINGNTTGCSYIIVNNYSSQKVYLSWDGKTVSWYSTNSAASQLNDSGITYYYIAIG